MNQQTKEAIAKAVEALEATHEPSHIECDGPACMGCWKDDVRKALAALRSIDEQPTPHTLPELTDDEIKMFCTTGDFGPAIKEQDGTPDIWHVRVEAIKRARDHYGIGAVKPFPVEEVMAVINEWDQDQLTDITGHELTALREALTTKFCKP